MLLLCLVELVDVSVARLDCDVVDVDVVAT